MRKAARTTRPRAASTLVRFFGAKAARRILEREPEEPEVRHGPVRRLGLLASLGEFSDFRNWTKNRSVSISASMIVRDQYRKFAVDTRQAVELYRAGATLTFNAVEHDHRVLRRVLDSLASELGLPPRLCHCNVYLSPAGGGLPKHFDAHHVVIVQAIGTKTWTVARNSSVAHPTENVVASRAPPGEVANLIRGKISPGMPAGSKTIALRPGSVLLVPSGHWHRTHAGEPSLSVTFGLRTLRWGEILGGAIASRLRQHPEWRELAWGALGDVSRRRAATKRFAMLIDTLDPRVLSFSAADLLDGAFEHVPDREE